MDTELDLETEEGQEFVLEVEEAIEAIKNGEIPGEYFEF